MPPCAGGGGLSSHPTPDMETEGQRNIRDGSSGRPGALLQISYFTPTLAVHDILQYYFGTGEDDK